MYNFTDENDYDDLVGDYQTELLANLRDEKSAELKKLLAARDEMHRLIFQD